MNKTPDGWLGTLKEWDEVVVLEYVLSQGYATYDDIEKYKNLSGIGWGFLNRRIKLKKYESNLQS